MNTTRKDIIGVEFDLAFKSDYLEAFQADIDKGTTILLAQPDTWFYDLYLWLEELRSQDAVKCPKIVRETNKLSMGLHFTDDLTIADLNKKWLSKSGSTDVLSFPVIDGNESFGWIDTQFVELGDIVVSVQTAEKQARIQNHSLVYELRWLVSHGLLHLLGWDHPSSKDLNQMLNFQQYLLNLGDNPHLENCQGIDY